MKHFVDLLFLLFSQGPPVTVLLHHLLLGIFDIVVAY